MNLQAADLRIGNYVNGILGTPEMVRGTTSHGIWLHGYPIIQSLLTPIPLTPEILLKMGFEKYNDDYVVKIGHRYFLCATSDMSVYTDNTDIEDNGRIWHDHIHYVHQLQNLFQALTGKELIFEL